MKKILIVGKGSYIGNALKNWLDRYPSRYDTDIVSARDGQWKEVDFSTYNTVIDLIGIAHISNITDEMRELFFSINRDMSIEIATWAKLHDVKHFILFSSMNVYGDNVDNLKDRSKTSPTSFYGESKLQGDEGVLQIESEQFIVSIIRPPFVYGKGCKGNYNRISSIAKKTPIFPNYYNMKSMIFIDNLCEFIRLNIDAEEGGIFTPQNKELVSTTDLVKEIARVNNHTIIFTKAFNCIIHFSCRVFRSIKRAFGNDCYDLKLSDYYGLAYCVVDFKTSIRLTER